MMAHMEKISRTQKKRAAQALQKTGERLVRLSDAQFNALVLPEDLLEAVALAREIKSHEAKRRQLQYIGRLMREIGSLDIEKELERISAGEAEEKRRFKLVERWRDELVAGNADRQAWLADQYPSIDPQELGRLVGNAQGKQPGTSAKKARRMLFRYLSRVLTGSGF
jgi:ribosome-associated protein